MFFFAGSILIKVHGSDVQIIDDLVKKTMYILFNECSTAKQLV